jgi:uncharacterized damage-inducible protein DinB
MLTQVVCPRSALYAAAISLVIVGQALIPDVARAQGKPPRWTTTTDVLREHEWGDATNNLLDIVAAMPDDKYAFRPATVERSFGEIVGHIADVQFGFCDMANHHSLKRESLEKTPAKDAVLRGLRASIAACDSAFDALSDARLTEAISGTTVADLFITMTGHTRRETGKLVAYLPIAGVKPPEIHYMLGRVWRTAKPSKQ